MKYCEKCGAQMEDEAVLCVACGCMVREVMAKRTAVKPVRQKSKRTDGERSLGVLFLSLAHSVLAMLSALFIILSMLWATYEVVSRSKEGVVKRFTMLPEESLVIMALVMGIFSLLCGLASFVVGLVMGTKNKEWIFAGIGKLVASVLLIIASALALALIG